MVVESHDTHPHSLRQNAIALSPNQVQPKNHGRNHKNRQIRNQSRLVMQTNHQPDQNPTEQFVVEIHGIHPLFTFVTTPTSPPQSLGKSLKTKRAKSKYPL